MAERSLTEIVQIMARQRGRGGQSPLLLLRTLEARAGGRISHLPINQRLEQAWVALKGEPFRPHQSLALSSLRRGEPFALVGGGPTARQTLYLLLQDTLRDTRQSRALLLLPDDATAALCQAELEHLNSALATDLTFAQISNGPLPRQASLARVLFATPETLHSRLLRHHDRAWQRCWANLHLIGLIDVDRYNGVAADHLAGLLLRSARLTAPTAPLFLAATLAEATNADRVLAQMTGHPWRIITVDDTPLAPRTLGIWHADTNRLRDAVALAQAYRREDYTVHITCSPLEIPLMWQLLGRSGHGISVGPGLQLAQVQIMAGYPGSHALFRKALNSDAQLTLLLLGNWPAERTLARLTRDSAGSSPLLDDPPTDWAVPMSNAYVAAQHLLCAASERPLTATEVDAWQADDLIARLERQEQLVALPDTEIAWQPLPVGADPYDGFSLAAAGVPTSSLVDEQGQQMALFDPSAFDRWGFVGAALPPGRGIFRVLERDDETGELTLKAEPGERVTFPLRRCNVNLRDERKQRTVRNRTVGWGRVVVEEEIYGYREVKVGNPPAEWVLPAPIQTRWAAPAVWIDLPMNLPAEGQLVGWSLAAALPLRVLCDQIDSVPAYDPTLRRIYLIDAQPGGNGLAAWLYEHLEALLPLAYDIALDCRNDPLWEPVARADMDWMLTLLGGEVALPELRSGRRTAAPVLGAGEWSLEIDEVQGAPRNVWPDPAAGPPDELPAYDEEPPAPPARPRPTTPPATEPAATSAPRRKPDAEPEPREEKSHQRAANAESKPKTRGRSTTQKQKQAEKQPRKPRQSRAKKPAQPPEAAAPPRAPPAGQPGPPPPEQQPPRPAKPATPPPEPPPEPPPDAAAMIARMRRLREQREAAARAERPASAPPSPEPPGKPVEPRFQVGDQIFCLPYGYGTVKASRIEEGKELLDIDFPDYDMLTLDPAVSHVRRVEPATGDEEDVL